MKIFMLLSLIVNFLNLIHCSAEECKIATECLPPSTETKTPIEIGIIYDLWEDMNANQPVIDLDEVACQVIKEFGEYLSLKRYPGATVTSSSQGISCGSYSCLRNQEDACKGVINSGYFTQCKIPYVELGPLRKCEENYASDGILKANGTLRCNVGIPQTRLPALMFNQAYDPCTDFTSAEQLKKFLCTKFPKALEGKGC